MDNVICICSTTKVSVPVADGRGLERHRVGRLERWGMEREELSGGHVPCFPVHQPIPRRILDRNVPAKNTSRAPSVPPALLAKLFIHTDNPRPINMAVIREFSKKPIVKIQNLPLMPNQSIPGQD